MLDDFFVADCIDASQDLMERALDLVLRFRLLHAVQLGRLLEVIRVPF
jgi:hypothetical protein